MLNAVLCIAFRQASCPSVLVQPTPPLLPTLLTHHRSFGCALGPQGSFSLTLPCSAGRFIPDFNNTLILFLLEKTKEAQHMILKLWKLLLFANIFPKAQTWPNLTPLAKVFTMIGPDGQLAEGRARWRENKNSVWNIFKAKKVMNTINERIPRVKLIEYFFKDDV